jgi:hypothetical protein
MLCILWHGPQRLRVTYCNTCGWPNGPIKSDCWSPMLHHHSSVIVHIPTHRKVGLNDGCCRKFERGSEPTAMAALNGLCTGRWGGGLVAPYVARTTQVNTNHEECNEYIPVSGNSEPSRPLNFTRLRMSRVAPQCCLYGRSTVGNWPAACTHAVHPAIQYVHSLACGCIQNDMLTGSRLVSHAWKLWSLARASSATANGPSNFSPPEAPEKTLVSL